MISATEKLLAVGDELTIFSRGEPRSIHKVARVAKRFIEIANGTKWRLDLRGPYPSNAWHSGYAERTTEEHRATIRRSNLINRLHSIDWSGQPLENLQAVWKIVRLIENARKSEDGEATE